MKSQKTEVPGPRSRVMIWNWFLGFFLLFFVVPHRYGGFLLAAKEAGAKFFKGKFQFGVMQMKTPCVSFFIQITYKKIGDTRHEQRQKGAQSL